MPRPRVSNTVDLHDLATCSGDGMEQICYVNLLDLCETWYCRNNKSNLPQAGNRVMSILKHYSFTQVSMVTTKRFPKRCL